MATTSTGNFQEQSTRDTLLQVIQTLRDNPQQYERLRTELLSAASDEERVDRLLDLATNEQDLAALIPYRPGGVELAAWTTVTVTTVFIFASSAY
jgi:hypothetical protein